MKKAMAILIVLLAGCATPTPYKPGAEREPGYRDLKLESNKYRITFLGNSTTSRETVEIYLLYRAAEITLRDGFDYFVVSEQNTDVNTKLHVTPAMYSHFSMGPNPYRRRYPYYAMGYPWSPQQVSSQTNYEAIAYVTLHKGDPKDKANAYTAKEVLANLESRIMRPTAK